MKECRKCKNMYQPTERQIKKHDFICKPCLKETNIAYREDRKKRGLPVSGSRMSREYQREYQRKYFSIDENKSRRNALMKKYREDPLSRHKHIARWLTRRAIEAGRLTRQPCEICGKIEVEAHHDDYYKPLDIRWLCKFHHNEHHTKANAKAEKS